jgi:hypothetical protein
MEPPGLAQTGVFQMSITTALRIEHAADVAIAVIEYICYCVIFGAIGIGWIITS